MNWRVRHLRPADYVRMPWRNGRGSTQEIAQGRFGAAIGSEGDFDWRLSIADIAADAPFSRFDGLDRVLTVIAGAGMLLTGADGAPRRLGLFDSIAFPGEDALDCRLIDGPTRDLNLMVRRDAARFVADFAEQGAGPAAEAALYLLVVLRGAVTADSSPLDATDCLIATADPDGTPLSLTAAPDARLFQASLFPASPLRDTRARA